MEDVEEVDVLYGNQQLCKEQEDVLYEGGRVREREREGEKGREGEGGGREREGGGRENGWRSKEGNKKRRDFKLVCTI